LTLTKQARDGIARVVGRLRDLFEEEFSDQAAGRFGFHIDRQRVGQSDSSELGETVEERLLRQWVEPLSALSLSPSQSTQRTELIGALSYLRREGLDGGEAVARLIREAAFTAVNRLLAVRVGEALQVFPAVTARGRQSASYREIAQDLFPLLAQEEDEGFWRYLQLAGDELGATVPLLFDRRLPVSAFIPSRTCVDRALEVLNDEDVMDVWGEPEALGWAYQFFNGDDVRKMREESPTAPRNSRELAVRNQFFTPRYVVDWLVQNTLGRRLQQAGYSVSLPLVVATSDKPADLELDDVKILDPACGSGHFLLGCYDLLEEAWRTRGVDPAEAAPRILRSLFGIDIDPRASQVAQVVLVLRARRSATTAHLDAPQIVTARPLPGAPEVRRTAFERLSPNAQDLAYHLDAALENAPLLGSLLKVEQSLSTLMERTLRTPKLAVEVSQESLESELIGAADQIAAEADASPAARMFGADARDALKFVALCQQRYDVVLMNPPFGDPVQTTRNYLDGAFKNWTGNLYAAFVLRGVELLEPHGYLGAITDRNGFFIKTFLSWRRDNVLPRLTAFLDLGLGVMHKAMVEAAAYSLSARTEPRQATFRRLIDESDKATATYEGSGAEFCSSPGAFLDLPGSPTAYWLSDEGLRLFSRLPPLESEGRSVRVGLQTSDDFRFLRLWWEVLVEDEDRVPRWRPFTKGGEYSPYYSDVRLVVDWERNGRSVREFPRSYIRNEDFYYRPGLTWAYKSDLGFCVKPVPRGVIFAHKGPMIFVPADDEAQLDGLMAFLNSATAAALVEPLVAFGKYEVGAVQRVPVVQVQSEVGPLVRRISICRMARDRALETSRYFVSPWEVDESALTNKDLAKYASEIDSAIGTTLGRPTGLEPLSTTYVSQWLRLQEPPSVLNAHQVLSYLIGAAFGRWDIRLANGTAEAPIPESPYAALPALPPGMLRARHDHLVPSDYPLKVPASRLLVDEAGHPQDVVAALELAATALTAGPRPPDIGVVTSIPDLRRFLRTKFFRDHLTAYSGSRRAAPIYWYLSVPSKEWGLWIYAPALSREMLFAIAGSARDRLRRLSEQASQLRNQVAGTASRQDADRLEKLDALASEVEAFLEAAEGIAQSGWAPDLNDGLILCAAPLESLFADESWRKDVAAQRKKLQKAEYPWAAVQRDYFGSTR
jgi:hypothetical protein